MSRVNGVNSNQLICAAECRLAQFITPESFRPLLFLDNSPVEQGAMDEHGDGYQNGSNQRDFQLLALMRHPPVNPELFSILQNYTMHGVDDHRNALLTDLFDENELFSAYYVHHESSVYNGNINNNADDNHTVDPHVEGDEPQPGGSRRRPREDDDKDESSYKRFRWWDEFDDTDSETDCHSEPDTDNDSDEDPGTEDDKEVSQPEEED